MSSVHYLLKLKKNIERQLSFFQEQERFQKEMSLFSFDDDEEEVKDFHIHLVHDFVQKYSLNELLFDSTEFNERDDSSSFLKKKIQHLSHLQEKIDDQLYSLCDHTFVKDYIDTFPDRSQMICYCTKCWSNYRTAK